MNIDAAQVYTDFNGLTALKAKARDDQDAALDDVARQFESLFTQMMLKSMREASFGGGLLDSKQSEFYRDMYDQQLSVHLSEKGGIGLADMLKRQLGGERLSASTGLEVGEYQGQPVLTVKPSGTEKDTVGESTDKVQVVDGVADMPGDSPQSFLDSLLPDALEVAEQLGLSPEAMLAQAALETGWGRHVIRHADGSSSHNLFGIKSDSRWSGEHVNVSTLEYRDGIALKTRAGFRSYQSFRASMQDYADFVRNNPRYTEALKVSADSKAYFQELQKAGYATDPDYATKINRILDSEPMQALKDRLNQQEGAKAI